jgi:dTDP-4-amino-4,6-dideoxygalactose transaminase
MKPIYVTEPGLPLLEEYIDQLKDIWDSKWLTNMGSKHMELEHLVSKYLDVPYLNLFANGHLALEYAIEMLQLKGEVITSPFTFASTTHAIVRAGLKPVFCDIDSKSYTIDASKIEELITDKTSAIIPIHIYGNICDLEAIESIATKYNLKVIYDGAHAFGVKVDQQGIGNFGDLTMFSFHATKGFNTIEGGGLTYNNPIYKSALDSIKNFGIVNKETVIYPGSNGKMNELQAAMGICNMKYNQERIEKRKVLIERYDQKLKGVEGIQLIEFKPNIQRNYLYYPVVFNDYHKTRDEIYEQLKVNDIYARKYFYPLTSDFECYEGEFDSDLTPIAQQVSNGVLTLPLYVDLGLEVVDRICDIILSSKDESMYVVINEQERIQ